MTLESGNSQDNAPAARASSQAECDAIVAAAKGNAARPSILRDFTPPPPLQPTDDLIETRLAEEIEYARRLLDAVSDRLIADPMILARHETTLQSFDIVGQLLGHLAKVTGSKDKAEAIDRIGMQELRARLMRPTAPIAATGTMCGLQRTSSNPFRAD
jgi:hypothetical protein